MIQAFLKTIKYGVIRIFLKSSGIAISDSVSAANAAVESDMANKALIVKAINFLIYTSSLCENMSIQFKIATKPVYQ
jgi:hypothetical protein